MKEIFRQISEQPLISREAVSSDRNIYGREQFVPEKARFILEQLAQEFSTHFRALGYSEQNAVPISSGIDPTVRFIGSHISILKPYIESRNIPNPGLFMVQGCIRTRNAQMLFDDEYFPKWGSYFPSFGVVAPPERLQEMFEDTLKFLEKINISKEHMRIRISSSDADLLEVCKNLGLELLLEVDSQKPAYYQHKIGMDGVRGRNLNIAIQNPNTGDFFDIGNIIVIENQTERLCVELAIGETTTIRELYGLEHVLDCHPVVGLEKLEPVFRRKLEDAILTTTKLFRENLKPNGSENRGRLLRTYLRSISYLRAKTGISLNDLEKIMERFESREFGNSDRSVTPDIINYLTNFEKEITDNRELSGEEKIVFNAHNILR